MSRTALKDKATSQGASYKTANLLDDIDNMTNDLYNVSTSSFYIVPNEADLNATIATINTSCTILISKAVTLTANLDLSSKSYITFKFVNSGYLSGNYTITFAGNCIEDIINTIFSSTITVTGYLKNEFVRPEWWGAVRNTITDDIIPINKAVQFAIKGGYNNGASPVVKFSDGTYKISSPILVFKFETTRFDFVTAHLIGNSYGYDKGTIIAPTFKDKPAIVIQATRNLKIENLHIIGLGSFPGLLDYGKLLDETQYLDSTLRDETHSPYSGICIDPFYDIARVVDRYPDLDQYYVGSYGSSGSFISKCRISNFVVGIMLSPSAGTQLNDSIEIIDCNLSENKVCIAPGQDQIRGLYVTNIHVNGCETVIDELRYGSGNLAASLVMNGGVITHARWLFLLSNRRGVNNINGLYAESIWSVGIIRNTSSTYSVPISFNDCYFHFIPNDDNLCWNTPHQMYNERCMVLVNGGYWGFYNNLYHRIGLYGNAGFYILKGITIDGHAPSPKIVFENEGQKFNTVQYEHVILRYGGANYETPQIINLNGEKTYEGMPGMFAGTFVNNDDGTATITTSYNQGFIIVGDYLYDYSSKTFIPDENYDTTLSASFFAIGKITDITGNVITLGRVPKGLSYAGEIQFFLYNERTWKQFSRSIGDVSANSPIITNVVNISNFKKYDIITVNATGLTGYSTFRILDITGTNITVNKNISATPQTCELYHFKLTNGNPDMSKEIYQSATQPSACYFKGDFIECTDKSLNDTGRYIKGWLCTATGNPGTLETIYYN